MGGTGGVPGSVGTGGKFGSFGNGGSFRGCTGGIPAGSFGTGGIFGNLGNGGNGGNPAFELPLPDLALLLPPDFLEEPDLELDDDGSSGHGIFTLGS